MSSDYQLVTELSRRRIAELIEVAPVWDLAAQTLGGQVEHSSALADALRHLRRHAPLTLEQAVVSVPERRVLHALGLSLYGALAAAWVQQAHTVAERPF